MKKIIRFLLFIFLLLTQFGMVFLASAIYDTSKKTTVETYFFQPADDYNQRTTQPYSISNFNKEELRNLLLEKYLMEYFYVIPNEQNIKRRQEINSTLFLMSSLRVFYNWRQGEAQVITELANAGILRTARLVSATQTYAEDKDIPYWKVVYELKTWENPYDILSAPKVEQGTLFMQISYSNQMMKEVRGTPVLEYLESGKDPAAAFSFGIIDIATEI